jgi:hypothetical protein
MAGEMTPEQWGIIKDGLSDIKNVAKNQADSELRLTTKIGDLELALTERIKGIEVGLFKGNGTKSLKDRVDALECEPDKKKNWVANIINLVIAVVAVGIAFFKP